MQLLDNKPVTVKQYTWFLTKTDHPIPLYWELQKGRNKQAVVGVSLIDARAYTRWAKKRLPTDTELNEAFIKCLVERHCPANYEWCELDQFNSPPSGVVRGGSWSNAFSDSLAASSRYEYDSGSRNDDVGFRCAGSAQ